jgi:hypothetical protein
LYAYYRKASIAADNPDVSVLKSNDPRRKVAPTAIYPGSP